MVDHCQSTFLQEYRCYLGRRTAKKIYLLPGQLLVALSDITVYVTGGGGVFIVVAFGTKMYESKWYEDNCKCFERIELGE